MQKHILLLTLVLLCSFSYGQTTINGKIIEKGSNEPLAFVNIGIVGKNIGTVTDMEGNYSLSVPNDKLNDKLKISMLGYEEKEYVVNDFIELSGQSIALKESAYKLDEVVINADKLRSKNVGRRPKKDHTNSGFTTNQLGNEIGALIHIKRSPSIVNNVKFRIAWNKLDTVFFRVNLYQKENGLPGESLLKQNVFVQTATKNGDVIVDLSRLDIVVEDDFFVCLELVKDYGKRGLMFTSRRVSNDGLYYRNTSQADWNYFESFALAIEAETLVE